MNDVLHGPLGILTNHSTASDAFCGLLVGWHGAEPAVKEVNRLLTAEDGEEPIAGHEEELILRAELFHTDFRLGNHQGPQNATETVAEARL